MKLVYFSALRIGDKFIYQNITYIRVQEFVVGNRTKYNAAHNTTGAVIYFHTDVPVIKI